MILCENKRILRKKGSENFEANKRNACETDLCSLRFALKRKKNISENRTPFNTLLWTVEQYDGAALQEAYPDPASDYKLMNSPGKRILYRI